MAMWTEQRERREAINVAVHQAGKEADAPILGGVDEPGLLPLSCAERTSVLWDRENRYDAATVDGSCLDRVGRLADAMVGSAN